jgi:hypothetical protein
MNTPSFYAHVLSGSVLFIALFFVFMHSNQLMKLQPHVKLVILLLFSIGAGVHGISHMALEQYYDYNPFNM